MGPEGPRDTDHPRSGSNEQSVDTEGKVETNEPAQLTPERRAEVMEQIAGEESRLESNLKSNVVSLDAAHAKRDRIAMEQLTANAKLESAYSKASDEIDSALLRRLGWAAFAASPGILTKAYDASFGSINPAFHHQMTDIYNNLTYMFMDAGVVVGGVAIAAAAINGIKLMIKQKRGELPATA